MILKTKTYMFPGGKFILNPGGKFRDESGKEVIFGPFFKIEGISKVPIKVPKACLDSFVRYYNHDEEFKEFINELEMQDMSIVYE